MTPSTRRFATLAALLSAVFMSAMEATVVATAMPTVVADLGGIELYGWVGAIYMLASTVTIPLFGKLADQRGRKPALMWGIAIFLLGSMASGMASSMLMLIAARGLQGIGAGAIQPVSMTLIGDLYPAEQRARVQGLFGAVWALAGVSGPLLGGFLVASLSWRWVFFVNLPFGAIASVLLGVALVESRESRQHSFDLLGMATLSGGVVCLLLGAGGTLPALSLPAALGLLGVFLLVEQRAQEPLVPLRLMRARLIAASNLCSLLLGAVMMGVLLYVPLYVQSVLGGSPTVAGTSVATMMLGWPLASSLSGRLIARFGYRRMVRVGGVVVLASTAPLLMPLDAETGPWLFRLNAFILGLGLGFANTAIIIAVQDSVERQQRGIATAALLFFRTIGGALSAGGLGGLLAASLGKHVPPELLDALMRPGHEGASGQLPADLLHYLEVGMHDVFLATALLGALACVTAFLFPQRTHAAPQRA